MDYKQIAAHCAQSLADGGEPIDGWGPVFYLLEQASVPLAAWRDVGDDWQPVPDDVYDPTGALPEGFTHAGSGVWVVGNLLAVVGTDGVGGDYACQIHWLFDRRRA